MLDPGRGRRVDEGAVLGQAVGALGARDHEQRAHPGQGLRGRVAVGVPGERHDHRTGEVRDALGPAGREGEGVAASVRTRATRPPSQPVDPVTPRDGRAGESGVLSCAEDVMPTQASPRLRGTRPVGLARCRCPSLAWAPWPVAPSPAPVT